MININDNFWRWFGKSKVLTKEKKPRIVYHGTVHEFNTFSNDYMNTSNFWGKGFYFTSSKPDVNKNYGTTKGPDYIFKLEREIDIFEDDRPDFADTLFKKYLLSINKDIDWYNSLNHKDEYIVKSYAYKGHIPMSGTNEGNVLPCFLRMEKPCYIGFGKRDTFFDFKYDYNEETEEYGDEAEGEIIDIIEYIRNEIDNGWEYGGDLNNIWDTLYDYNGIFAGDFFEKLRSSIYSEGDGTIGALFSDAIQSLGYDGIIQKPKVHFTDMEGIAQAIHYIVFDPIQIKSIYNKGTWSLTNKQINENHPIELIYN